MKRRVLGYLVGSMVILVVTAIVVAGHHGVDVLAISAALGLTGFAMVLALKDTITNIFLGARHHDLATLRHR